jgi:hypothetical protein
MPMGRRQGILQEAAIHMKTTKTFLAVAGLAAAIFVGAARGERATPPRFAEVVASNFEAWDADHDGSLSSSEIDKLVVNPSIQGPEAAAAAALKRILRSEKYELPSLTKAFLTKPLPSRTSKRVPANTDRDDSTERGTAPSSGDDKVPTPEPKPIRSTGSTPTPDFQSRYAQSLSRIEKTDRSLFGDDNELSIDHCHQGPLGDCFFVAPVGGLVKKSAADVRAMISPLTGVEGYNVKFGNGRVVRVAPLTDAEVAISSTTLDGGGQDGLWLAVLEKAFGTLRRDDNPSRYEMESATDAIAKGGSTASTIQLLTGHAVQRITLKRPVKGWIPEEFDRNRRRVAPPSGTVIPTEPAGDVDVLAKKVRDGVKKTLAAGRLVATGTGDDRQPPGISGKHAYAVLAFDEAKDTLTLWNPHGNSFKPKGEAGRLNGYPTKAGIFEIPVADFVRVFNGVSIETEKGVGRGRA